jgi:CubicO group peptidase (beta-lactamase class C family)
MTIARKIGKALLYLLLLLLLAIALFTAFNWALVSNMVSVAGSKVTDVDKFQPAQRVKGCTSAPLATNASAFPADAFAQMKSYSDAHGGVGLVVLRDGAIAAEAYRPGANSTTRASSQSMHKSVVGLMVGAAIAEGIIASADDPVGKYITEWHADPRGKITIRQLLSMASGLKNASMAKMEMPALNLMLGRVSSAAMDSEIAEAPGRFNYKNVDFQLAGMVLARALKKSGRGSYADYLSAKLWCPLGNQDSALWLEFDGGEPRYFAFLDSTVRDWARVGEMVRMGGMWRGQQLIPADWVKAATAPSLGNPNYGLGIWRGSPWQKARRYSKEVSLVAAHSAPYLANDVLLFDGFGGQRVYIIPSAGLVISRSGETSLNWDDAQLVNLALKGLKAP